MEEYVMKKATAPISLAGSKLGEVRHGCAFFNSDDEEYRVLLPFIKDGFECGEKAAHVVEDRSYIDDLVEFESRVNDVWRGHDDAVIRTYNLAKFGGET
jgi:hypothetical protein